MLEEVQVRGGRLVVLVRGTNPSRRKKKTKKREWEGRGDRGGECRGKSGRDGEGSRMHERRKEAKREGKGGRRSREETGYMEGI